MTKQQDISSIGSISISVMAQWKMALHATSKPLLRGGDAAGSGSGGGPTIHGIVLGHRAISTASATSNDSKASLIVTDVVPVCRETPTKPMVDMALRLVEAHLVHKQQQQQQQSQLKEETKIIGWYTNSSISNSGGDDTGEEDEDTWPNASACRILSSMAELSCDADDHHGPFVLLSLINSKLDTFMTNQQNNTSSQVVICNVFQWDTKSRKLVKRDDVVVVNEKQGHKLRLPTEVYDFVDHMNDCDLVDSKWIENY